MDGEEGTEMGSYGMDNEQDTLILQVEGMSCTGCEQRIRNVLRRVQGVRDASADHTTGRVEVRVDPGQVELGVLAARITEAGYSVTGRGVGQR